MATDNSIFLHYCFSFERCELKFMLGNVIQRCLNDKNNFNGSFYGDIEILWKNSPQEPYLGNIDSLIWTHIYKILMIFRSISYKFSYLSHLHNPKRCQFVVSYSMEGFIMCVPFDSTKHLWKWCTGTIKEAPEISSGLLVSWNNKIPSVKQNLCEGRIITFHLLHTPGELINLEVTDVFME